MRRCRLNSERLDDFAAQQMACKWCDQLSKYSNICFQFYFLVSLYKNTNLQQLELHDNNISDEGAQQITKVSFVFLYLDHFVI